MDVDEWEREKQRTQKQYKEEKEEEEEEEDGEGREILFIDGEDFLSSSTSSSDIIDLEVFPSIFANPFPQSEGDLFIVWFSFQLSHLPLFHSLLSLLQLSQVEISY